MRYAHTPMQLRVPLPMSFRPSARPHLLVSSALLLLYLKQNVVQVLLPHVLWEVAEDPGFGESLQRSQPLSWLHCQHLLHKIAKLWIGKNALERPRAWDQCLAVLSLDYLGTEIFVEELLCVFTLAQKLFPRSPNRPKYERKLLLLIISGIQRHSKREFGDKATEAPHIDGSTVLSSKNHLRRPVESGLDVAEMSLVKEHASTEVNYLYANLSLLLDQNVFRLDVGMDNSQLLEEGQGKEDLDGERTDILRIQGSEVIALKQLIQVRSQQLRNDADVPPEYNEVFDSQNIFAVFDVFLLDAHQDVDLIEGQVHLFPPRPHNLHTNILSGFVIVCPDHLSEGASAQPLQQFISVSYLFMLLPHVPSFKVILTHSGPDSDVVDCLLVYQFNALML